ncbi:MAG: iron chaperone, partial [Draconibacterium sp.]
AVESIAYGMPAYKLNKKPLVYFAAYARHIGFYATPSGHQEFASELSVYKQGKGSVQFPIDEPLPTDLIRRIVAFRVKENMLR